MGRADSESRMCEMIFVGDKTQFLASGLEEQDFSLVYCHNPHCPDFMKPIKIPVEFNLRWKEFRACDEREMICKACSERMQF